MNSPELIATAGDLDRMRTAFDYAADAIYAGQPRYSLRARNNDFIMVNLDIGIKEAHVEKSFLWRVIFHRIMPRLKPIWRIWRL